MSAGLNRYLPFTPLDKWVRHPIYSEADSTAGRVRRRLRPQDYPRDLLKEAIAEGKAPPQILVWNFYPLSDVTTNATDWCVMQVSPSCRTRGHGRRVRRHQSSVWKFRVRTA